MSIDEAALLRTVPWSAEDQESWEANADHSLDPFFTYSDRESYLAWVVGWKADYVSITAEIRGVKRERRVLQQSGAYDRAAAAPLLRAKKLARALLVLRRAAKRDSWAKRNAAKVA